ncbi:MAG: ROK family protein [Hyphomicrobiaceae bacterium]|nr:ROK family protein [Hyphomicrobiaceae bacterium]
MRIGIDLGGTKISLIALDEAGQTLFERRVDTPKEDYHGTIAALHQLVVAAKNATGQDGTIGIGMPGSLSPRTGLVQNGNSTWLNGKAFQTDLDQALQCEVRLANDANCFALSEAIDGAASPYQNVFGVIIGTGCGGALVVGKKLINGPRNITGEWGHVPLPWALPDEHPGSPCWCGQRGCMETFVSGPALALDHFQKTGEQITAQELHQRSLTGDEAALASLSRHSSRLARGLAMVSNIFDPDVIVLGGGLSQMPHLYEQLPALIAPYLFTDDRRAVVVAPLHGDASGVRGAAWLWNR